MEHKIINTTETKHKTKRKLKIRLKIKRKIKRKILRLIFFERFSKDKNLKKNILFLVL